MRHAPAARVLRFGAGVAAAAVLVSGCGDTASLPLRAGMGPDPALPEADAPLIPTIEVAPAVGWPDGRTPVPANGLEVGTFATGLDHPRWLHVLPNGDVLVAETNAPPRPEAESGITGFVMSRVLQRAGAAVPSADRIRLLRDTDGDGVADTHSVLLEDLHSPFGMALVGRDLYVANTDGVVRFPYRPGVTHIDAAGEHIVDLPAGPLNQHWTRNLIWDADSERLYVTVGSSSNIAENGMESERGRALILEVDPGAKTARTYASGLRNPNGLDWQPETGELWTTVNERDGLGSELVPDYLTSVAEGGFYGWPYSYFGANVDERVEPQRPDLVEAAIVPDYALGPHVAALGLAFYTGALLPDRYRNGAFVALHGSWNRRPLAGYAVVFVPFSNGEPEGLPETVLTGFVNDDGEAFGRPVGVAVAADGAVLVADDVGNAIWRLRSEGR